MLDQRKAMGDLREREARLRTGHRVPKDVDVTNKLEKKIAVGIGLSRR